MRILVARTDRLGDVLLSLPAIQYLRTALPGSEIDFVCQHSLHKLLGGFAEKYGIALMAASNPLEPDSLERWRAREYDGALFLHCEPSYLAAAWRVAIPVRVGIYSKPPSFLWLNQGLRQRRSRAEQNEAEYNVELAKRLTIEFLGEPPTLIIPRIELPINQVAKEEAEALLEKCGLERKKFSIVHPGMRGSALNLTAREYLQLIDRAKLSLDMPVALTAGPFPTDRTFSKRLRAERPDLAVFEDLGLPLLMELFRQAAVVFAPSTGPLHLAHYVGTDTLGFYSPIRSQRKERWAPWGGTGRSVTLAPSVQCPASTECLGKRCRAYYCMDHLPWREWMAKIRSHGRGIGF